MRYATGYVTYTSGRPVFSLFDGCYHTIELWVGAVRAARIDWSTTDGEVIWIEVDPDFQRRGLATKLWEKAKQHDPRIMHSEDLSEDGAEWVASLRD